MKLQPEITAQPSKGQKDNESASPTVMRSCEIPLECHFHCMCHTLKMWQKVGVIFHKANETQLVISWSWWRSLNVSCQAVFDQDFKTSRNRKGSFVINYWECHLMNPVSVGCPETPELRIALTSNECVAFCINL